MRVSTVLAEGEIPFDVPDAGKPCVTWYKIVGDLRPTSTIPLIIAHGGPGGGHEYLLSLADMYELYGVHVVFYDQIGCGRSTRLPEKMGDESFWSVELFVRELDNLIDHLGLRERGFDFLGHSWGAMLGAVYGARRPRGLRKLILASGPSSIPLYIKGLQPLVQELPDDVRGTILECDKKGDYESEAYKKACDVFYKRHMCRMDPWPEEVRTAFVNLESDPTVYLTMLGPSELVATGNLKNWDCIAEVSNIKVETLLTNGFYDGVRDLSVYPLFKQIPKVKWVQFGASSHMSHWEERDRFMKICGSFLGHDTATA